MIKTESASGARGGEASKETIMIEIEGEAAPRSEDVAELRAIVERLQGEVAALRSEVSELRAELGLRKAPGHQADSQGDDTEIDADWRARMDALRPGARAHAEDMGYPPDSPEGRWVTHEFFLSSAFTLAQTKRPDVKPPKITAHALAALHALVIWNEQIAEGVVPNDRPGWRWVGFDRLSHRLQTNETTTRRAVQYLADLGLVKLERALRGTQVDAIEAGRTNDFEPKGPICRVDIAWAKLGGYPGPRPPEIRERQERFASFGPKPAGEVGGDHG